MVRSLETTNSNKELLRCLEIVCSILIFSSENREIAR